MITKRHLLVVIRFTDEYSMFWPVLHIMIELVLGSVVRAPCLVSTHLESLDIL